jgi:hypothetical protein
MRQVVPERWGLGDPCLFAFEGTLFGYFSVLISEVLMLRGQRGRRYQWGEEVG